MAGESAPWSDIWRKNNTKKKIQLLNPHRTIFFPFWHFVFGQIGTMEINKKRNCLGGSNVFLEFEAHKSTSTTHHLHRHILFPFILLHIFFFFVCQLLTSLVPGYCFVRSSFLPFRLLISHTHTQIHHLKCERLSKCQFSCIRKC